MPSSGFMNMYMYRLVIVFLLLSFSGPAMHWQCSGASQPKPWKSPILTVGNHLLFFDEEWRSFREAFSGACVKKCLICQCECAEHC